MSQISKEEMQKAIEDSLVNVHSYDPNSPSGYKQDLFDISNEDFVREYEFVDSSDLDDMVKHKQSDEVFKVFYKKDGKIRLLRVSNMQALNHFDHLKGVMTKIILDSGFKPDEQ
ncbi:hypothetical protein EWX78_08905 [Campylobacter coli]|uniref:Uncharacterized protein n=1 Tax=Campylobacter coli TaxID=195 RepID=A0A644SA25_CAMCO|nr:hypothetical protein [Campylobacter coli]EAI3824140.1 hypothetical protein [Campylobacter coli]EAI5446926.1 hypothetical protein [Campylobacter coli]EAJ2630388.1 hypothetical protein [Campylobacter coli]EAJ9198242.1 hypothetical protein [Campylobacter coli]